MAQNEALVNMLVQETGCDHEIASMLLRFTDGDLDGARRILKSVSKDVFIIKAKFVAETSGEFGAFMFCYDEKEKGVKRLISVITDTRDIGKIDVETGWRDFEEELYRYLKSTFIDSLRVEQFEKSIYSKDFLKKIGTMFKSGKPLKKETMHGVLIRELYNIFPDTNIAIKFEMEVTDAFELNKALKEQEEVAEVEEIENKELKGREEEKKQRGKGKDQSLVVMKVDPVLSPVGGTEIRFLEFGDEIQVRITDEREIAEYLADLIGGRVLGERIPVVAKVVEVQELDEGYASVLTQFGPGIMGLFRALADVKVASVANMEEGQLPGGMRNREITPVIVVGGIVLGVILFVLLLFLSR